MEGPDDYLFQTDDPLAQALRAGSGLDSSTPNLEATPHLQSEADKPGHAEVPVVQGTGVLNGALEVMAALIIDRSRA